MLNLLNTQSITALVTLTVLEIVLGIDNIVFISILVARVPVEKREFIRKLGIFLALLMRILLLFSISWVMGLTAELFEIASHGYSGRDLILIFGGLFLIFKSTSEIHHKVTGEALTEAKPMVKAASSFILVQIVLLDIVFSLDSVITAVGMANDIKIMIAAMSIAMVVMLVFAKAIGDFVDKNPTIKILALSFLLLIGVMLIAEGMGQHVSKGYIYFAMSFSLGVEILNMRYRRNRNGSVFNG